MPHIRNVVNRTLLGLLATAVVAGGLWAVATHSALRDRLPDGWAAATSPAHLLDGGVPSPGGVPGPPCCSPRVRWRRCSVSPGAPGSSVRHRPDAYRSARPA
ncbi:hypothetical protein O1L55_32655 [Streptomyces albulus]|nr:hypothetical protein [Streptomyces noursei]